MLAIGVVSFLPRTVGSAPRFGALTNHLPLNAEALSPAIEIAIVAKDLTLIFPLWSLDWNNPALIEEAKQPLVHQIGRCLERSGQATRRTRLPPVLFDDAPAFSAPKKRCQHTIERIPPVEFADQPQIFVHMDLWRAIGYIIAVWVPAVEVARLIDIHIGAVFKNLEVELQVCQQTIRGVPYNSGRGSTPNHDIGWAADTICHSAEAEIDHSAPRMCPGELNADSFDVQNYGPWRGSCR